MGSTSVPGLCAKPTIDVMAVLDELAAVADRVEPLARIGYEYRPGSFAADEGHMFLRKMADGKRTHHLHAVAAGSPLADELPPVPGLPDREPGGPRAGTG